MSKPLPFQLSPFKLVKRIHQTRESKKDRESKGSFSICAFFSQLKAEAGSVPSSDFQSDDDSSISKQSNMAITAFVNSENGIYRPSFITFSLYLYTQFSFLFWSR